MPDDSILENARYGPSHQAVVEQAEQSLVGY
jgi:hypothetical protein